MSILNLFSNSKENLTQIIQSKILQTNNLQKQIILLLKNEQIQTPKYANLPNLNTIDEHEILADISILKLNYLQFNLQLQRIVDISTKAKVSQIYRELNTILKKLESLMMLHTQITQNIKTFETSQAMETFKKIFSQSYTSEQLQSQSKEILKFFSNQNFSKQKYYVQIYTFDKSFYSSNPIYDNYDYFAYLYAENIAQNQSNQYLTICKTKEQILSNLTTEIQDFIYQSSKLKNSHSIFSINIFKQKNSGDSDPNPKQLTQFNQFKKVA